MIKVAVASRSFSKHPKLRKELLRRYPFTKFNDEGVSLHGNDLVNFLKGCEKAITALEIIDENVLSQLPDLQIIGKYGVGLDMIDLDAMNKFSVKLGWTGGVNRRSVSELVISAAIGILHKSFFSNKEVLKKSWYQIKGRQLSECTFGIIGCGHIGKDLVKLLKPFNCNVLSHDIKDYSKFYAQNNVTKCSLNDVLKKSDVISLHLPLDDSTRNILSKERLDLLKNDAVLINYARGGLIDEGALKRILKNDKLTGVALDVFNNEPPKDFELISHDKVFVTPHIGGSSEEAIYAMGMAAIDGLDSAKEALSYKL